MPIDGASEVIVAGSTPLFKVELVHNETLLPIDLAAGTVRFKFRIGSGAIQDRQATITDEANGKAEYLLPAIDCTAGTFKYWWKAVDALGNILFNNKVPFERRIISEG